MASNVSSIRPWRFGLFALAVCLSGCGDLARLVVHLDHPAEDDPFAEVTVLRLLLQQQEDPTVLFDDVFNASETRFELPEVDRDGPVRLSALGYRDESLADLAARGASDWLAVPAGGSLEVGVCFCSLAFIDDEACLCPEP